jgi:hypothetical protein
MSRSGAARNPQVMTTTLPGTIRIRFEILAALIN